MEEIKKVKVFIYNNLAWLFLLVGILILFFSATYPFEGNYFKNVYEKVGISIFSSGVFAAVLKSLQFTGIFKQEIEKVMLRSDFVKKRNDLPELWKTISHELYRQKFPEISDKIDSIVLENYFPIESDYYYSDFRVTIKIEDISDDFIIKYTQTVKYDIIFSPEITAPITKSNFVIGDKGEGDNIFKNELIHYRCNSIDIEAKLTVTDENNETKHTYECVLDPAKGAHIETKEKRQYSIKKDNIKLFRLGHIAKEMDVSISFPADVHVTFFNVGLVNNFEVNHVEHTNTISRIHKKGLILPHQGFGLTFRKIINQENQT